MLKMSFYDGTLNRKVLRAAVETTDKEIVYTHGLIFRHPTTYRKPISKTEAFRIIDNESLLDATEEANCIHLNSYGESDMW